MADFPVVVSVTVRVKVRPLFADVGVPLMVKLETAVEQALDVPLRPAGSEPEVMHHLYGPVPPAVIVVLYGEVTVPVGNTGPEPDVTKAKGETVRVVAPVVIELAGELESLTVTLNEGGVPAVSPEPEQVNTPSYAGAEPVDMLHAAGPVVVHE
jgi:hypothetical protein